jgi:hypothetical protein
MAARWGTPCDTCGLDRAMCLGHQEPPRRSDEETLRRLLAVVQAWQVILLQIEDALIAEIYGLGQDDSRQAA